MKAVSLKMVISTSYVFGRCPGGYGLDKAEAGYRYDLLMEQNALTKFFTLVYLYFNPRSLTTTQDAKRMSIKNRVRTRLESP